MSYRGSLTQCIDLLGNLFATKAYPLLSILVVPKGKYYKVMTDEELQIAEANPEDGDSRIVFRGTLKELSKFQTPTAHTGDLFAGTDNNQ